MADSLPPTLTWNTLRAFLPHAPRHNNRAILALVRGHDGNLALAKQAKIYVQVVAGLKETSFAQLAEAPLKALVLVAPNAADDLEGLQLCIDAANHALRFLPGAPSRTKESIRKALKELADKL